MFPAFQTHTDRSFAIYADLQIHTYLQNLYFKNLFFQDLGSFHKKIYYKNL